MIYRDCVPELHEAIMFKHRSGNFSISMMLVFLLALYLLLIVFVIYGVSACFGVYYMPTQTRLGKSILKLGQVP